MGIFRQLRQASVHNDRVISFFGLGTTVNRRLFLFLSIAALSYAAGCNGQRSAGIPTTRTGILLASDTSKEWALVSGTEFFFVRGNPSELAKFERRRVTVGGTVDAGRQLTVQSIVSSEMSESEIRKLIEQLRGDEWSTPRNMGNPTDWQFNFTEPMLRLLQADPAAQTILLQYLDDQQIKDHVIILLGGVGNEESVEPIIRAMAEKGENQDKERRLNLIANLALTNITVSDVIWHHGGGITVPKCPNDPKSCWNAWWLKNKNTFKVTAAPSRNYSNYPDYGIYKQP
jgi:hypothetical protein